MFRIMKGSLGLQRADTRYRAPLSAASTSRLNVAMGRVIAAIATASLISSVAPDAPYAAAAVAKKAVATTPTVMPIAMEILRDLRMALLPANPVPFSSVLPAIHTSPQARRGDQCFSG